MLRVFQKITNHKTWQSSQGSYVYNMDLGTYLLQKMAINPGVNLNIVQRNGVDGFPDHIQLTSVDFVDGVQIHTLERIWQENA
jgi:hypothetical protein